MSDPFGINLETTPTVTADKKACKDNVENCHASCPYRSEIMIDHKEGEPNFEKVGVNGFVFKIMRGVHAAVPKCVIHVLENATESYYVEVPDPNEAGKKIRVEKTRCAIPWRKV